MRRAGLPLRWGCDPTTVIWASFVLWFAPSAHAKRVGSTLSTSSTSIIFPGPFAQYPPGKPAEKEEIQAGIPSCKAMQTKANTCKFMPTPANLPCLSRKVLGGGYHQVPAPLFPYPMAEGGSRAQTDTRAEAPSLSTYCVQGPAPGAGYTAGPR